MITSANNKIRAKVQASMKELDTLESEASQLRKSIEEHDAAREHNHAIATKRASLESEREDLQLTYMETSFEGGDVEGIHERRRTIDEELASLRPVDVPEVDGYALADVSHRAKSLSFPGLPHVVPGASLGILQPMYDELQTLRSEHHERKRAAVEGFGKYITTEDEHAVKMERDADYSRNHRAHEAAEEKRKADNLRKYDTEEPSFNNTDEMHTAMARAKRKRLQTSEV